MIRSMSSVQVVVKELNTNHYDIMKRDFNASADDDDVLLLCRLSQQQPFRATTNAGQLASCWSCYRVPLFTDFNCVQCYKFSCSKTEKIYCNFSILTSWDAGIQYISMSISIDDNLRKG